MSTKMDEKELKEMAESKEEKTHKATIQALEDGEYFVEIPQTLLDELGWELGDDINIKETEYSVTEFWDTWGKYKGLMIFNLTKNPEASRR